MAKIIETEIGKEEILEAVLEKFNINEFNSIRIWEGEKEIMFKDLKIVIYQDDDKASLPLSDDENKKVLEEAYRTKDGLSFNIASVDDDEEFRIDGNNLLTVMHNAITKDIVKQAVEYEYNEDEGILGQITDAIYEVRKYLENEYDFPKSKLINLGLSGAIYEFVRFQGIKHFKIDIADKEDGQLLITLKGTIEHCGEIILLDKKYCSIDSFMELEATMKHYVREITKEEFNSSKVEASPDSSSSIIYKSDGGSFCLYVTMEHDSKKIVFPSYYPSSFKPYILQNSGDLKFYVQEYKDGEFGIYDEENNELYADCFKSVEQAQDWYDNYAKKSKELKARNDEIIEDIENVTEPLEKEIPSNENYIIIYRDELRSDKVFEQYKSMKHAIYDSESDRVKFFTHLN